MTIILKELLSIWQLYQSYLFHCEFKKKIMLYFPYSLYSLCGVVCVIYVLYRVFSSFTCIPTVKPFYTHFLCSHCFAPMTLLHLHLHHVPSSASPSAHCPAGSTAVCHDVCWHQSVCRFLRADERQEEGGRGQARVQCCTQLPTRQRWPGQLPWIFIFSLPKQL